MNVRRGGVALPSLAAGVLLALSLPPFGIWPLAFVGAALLFWRLGGLSAGTRIWSGWLCGLGCFVPGLLWAQSFNWYGAVILMAVEALSMALAAALVPARGARLAPFIGAFVLAEALRMAWPFGGLPIGGVFLGQAGGPFLGLSRLGGPLLLTAVVWAGGGTLAALAGALDAALSDDARDETRLDGGRRPTRSPARAGSALATLLVVLALIPIAAAAPDGGRATARLDVAAVQGGGQRGLSKAQVDPSAVFSAQVAATSEIPGHPGARPSLVLWPEDVIALDRPLVGSPEAAEVAALARRLDATVVAGVTVTISSSAFRNEIVAWGPDGRIVGTFEKVHRVPFGEYVPWRGFFSHLANLSAVPLDAVPGTGTGLLPTPAARLGVLVSYEVFYSNRSRPSVRAGADLLVVPTNTSSYASSQVPTQEIAAARVQAVETGRDLVQAAPTGFSAVIDHDGTIVERSALGERSVLYATVGLRLGSTLYDRIGDVPVLVLAALALVAGWAMSRRRRPRRPRIDGGTITGASPPRVVGRPPPPDAAVIGATERRGKLSGASPPRSVEPGPHS